MVTKTFIFILLVWNTLQILSNQSHEDPSTDTPSPLILVPGDGGSRSYASVSYFLFSVMRLVWVNFQYMIFPGGMTDIFKLIYDPATRTTNDVPGTKVTFPGWGSTEMIEDLDEWKHKQTTYFSPLVDELLLDQFFVRNITLRGAPYDFRKAPNENSVFFDNLKRLVEDTYEQSGKKRTVLLGHSLGALYSLYFLKRMSLSWKKKYIRSFVSVSAPLAGAVKALKLEILGDSIGSPRDPHNFREMQRSFPSTAFLLPKSKVFGNEPLVLAPQKNYSANDYQQLFQDMDFEFGAMMYEDTKDLVDGALGPEGIDDVHCIHGHSLNTEDQLQFFSFKEGDHKSSLGDGDATVNLRSLELCRGWPNVHYYTIPEGDHMEILADNRFINKLKEIVYQKPYAEFPVTFKDTIKKEKFIIQFF